jgi:hypothetical protein
MSLLSSPGTPLKGAEIFATTIGVKAKHDGTVDNVFVLGVTEQGEEVWREESKGSLDHLAVVEV